MIIKNWFWSGLGLSACTLLLFAHVAPAKATRPLMHATGVINTVKLSLPQDLQLVTEKGLLGIHLEEAKLRKALMAQARAYIDVRKNSRAKATETFIAGCINGDASDNPYCAYEAKCVVDRANNVRSPKELTPVVSLTEVMADLQAAELEKLAKYSVQDLTRAAGHIDDIKTLSSVIQKVTAKSDCGGTGELAAVLASKAEEGLPDPAAIDSSRQLHKKAADCAGEPAASRSQLRYSLMSVWQNKCAEASEYLKKLSSSSDSHFAARGKYWRYHCATVSKNLDEQKLMREALWKDHLLSFHNLAVNGRDERLKEVVGKPALPKVAVRSLVRPDLNDRLRALEGVLEAGDSRIAAEMAERMASDLTSAEPEVRLYVSALMSRAGQALPKFRILNALIQDVPRMAGRETLNLLYPKWYLDKVQARTATQLDPFMIMALIRQESAFNVKAHSSAGARGLMQVMPATARSIARVRGNKLFDPETNIKVGTKYFMHRLGQFNQDVELTLAAYNAGATRVDRWVKRYPMENKMLFVDLVPFRETRDYISSILRNYYWYSLLYKEPGPSVAAILDANAGASAVRGPAGTGLSH